jgi:hypothetical protein
MKSPAAVADALGKVDTSSTQFAGMTYEQGVEEALMWVLGELEDEDFEYADKRKG